MKTAISIPDEVFARVEERAAALNLNRSQFFVRAAENYLLALDDESVTSHIDAAVRRDPTYSEPSDVANVGLSRLEQLTADDSW
jgi:hypothetical protein